MNIEIYPVDVPTLYVDIDGFRWEFSDLFSLLFDIKLGLERYRVRDPILAKFLEEKKILKHPMSSLGASKGENFDLVYSELEKRECDQ